MITVVEVDVAIRRPPRADGTRRVVVHTDGDDLREAELIACQLAGLGAVMPVGSRVVDVLEV